MGPIASSWSEANSEQKHIYLVEDEEPVRILISRILEKNQYCVTSFENGEDFLSAIQKASVLPDLVMLDTMLPGISGLEILTKLKQDEKFMHLSVVMITGSPNPEIIKQSYQVGAIDYLIKPILPSLLRERTQSNLSLKIDAHEVSQILNFLHLEENSLLSGVGLKEYRNTGVSCFPVLYKSIQLCFLIPFDTRPQSMIGSPLSVLESNIMIFRKSSIRWNKIWPLKGRGSHPTTSSPVSHSHEKISPLPAESEESLKKKGLLKISELPHIHDSLESLKQKKMGSVPHLGNQLWKSIYKWSDQKIKCENEMMEWQVKIQQEGSYKESA